MSKISSGSLTVVDVKGGSDGINTATIYLYQRAATAPSKPSTNLTYTFATAKLTGGLGSWTQDIGTLTGSDPIWVIAAVASSNGTTDVIESTEWSEPIKMAQNGQDGQDGQDGQPGAPGQPGANGLNQATVFIYKRANSVTKPSNSTYTFATGSFTVDGNWEKTIPTATTENRNPCWVCSAVAIGSGDTAQLNWTNPVVLVEDGSDGQSPVITSTDNGVQIYDPINDVTYTITNGADGTSYYTHILYSSKEVPTSASDVNSSPENKDYVGILTTNTVEVPAWNDNRWVWKKYIGENGQPGTQGDPGPQGVSVTGTRELYYLKTNSENVPSITSTSQIDSISKENGWTSVVPTYADSGTYYTCIETSLSTGGPVWSVPVENKGLTDANKNAYDAATDASEAKELSRATQQHFWFKAVSDTLESGAYITDTAIDTFKNGKSGGYALIRSDGLLLGNGVNRYMELSGSALKFYKAGTTDPAQGSSIPSTSIAAQLNSTGLEIASGGIVAGQVLTNNFVYLSTEDYPLRQYVKTSDNPIVSTKTYYTYNSETQRYSPVTTPDDSERDNYYEISNQGLTVNRHTPGDATNDPAWRQVIGSKFGVDASGTLYASGAVLDDTLTIQNKSGQVVASYGQTTIIGNKEGNQSYIEISDDGISFYGKGQPDVASAHIDGQYMYIPYTVVLNEMQVGQYTDEITGEERTLWSWKKMGNKNLRLVWLGGDS